MTEINNSRCCNCLETLDKYQEDLEAKAKNAFNRRKWGMFAYYKAQAVHIRRVRLLMRKGRKLKPARSKKVIK